MPTVCLPGKTDQQPAAPASASRSILGIGGLMLLACLGGPVLAGAIGGLGIGALLGAGGAIFALALCAAAPAVVIGLRRRSSTRRASPKL
jgi:hypothetical protein